MSERPRRKPVTPAYLDRAAVHYLDRYASSADNLARILTRKVRRRLEPGEPVSDEVAGWIAATVARAIRSGLVDDASYAATRVASLMRRGSSTRAIRAKLAAKGVPGEAAATAIRDGEPDDLALARRFAERRRLGPWRRIPDPALRDRDLAALCRAGFPYRIAAAALDGTDM